MDSEEKKETCMEERANESADELQEKSREESFLTLMGFKLAEEEYAVDIMQIKEITIPTELTPIPRAPEYILGILSLRGNILPVFDAKRRLGLPAREETHRTRIIIVNHQGEQVGLLVDDITSAARISASAIEPPPPILNGVEAEYITGVGRVNDRMIILMDIEKICRMEETVSA
ncbi:MAG: chemotaxis protein CheW [Deltaproteobacteria bacterium]|nr:chemotaxis protein CheW [Deltaproteobacteria bacterium]